MKKQAYFAGKYFDSVEEMLAYAAEFLDRELDVYWYWKFLNQRHDEAQFNLDMWKSGGKVFTNRDALLLLKSFVDLPDCPPLSEED